MLPPNIRMRACLAFLVVALSLIGAGQTACASKLETDTLPARLSDEEFWRLSEQLSEAPGAFTHSENLVSNEPLYAHTVRALRARGGAYIGVGPEQNFSYIARVQPAMAFIIDIRNENRHLHLMYKALMEMSADRAEFVSRLFSRARPASVDGATSVADLFRAYAAAEPVASLYEAGAREVRQRLVDVHRIPLTPDDVSSIDRILLAFYSDGPDIHYGRLLPASAAGPSYRALMTAVDVWGQPRSYLTSEDTFAVVKALHWNNLIVPVVGDFGRAGAIDRVGDYIRRHGGAVSAFYGSNVEVYLNRQQLAVYCGQLMSLPSEWGAWFIGSKGVQLLSAKVKACATPRR
jgi:hypothetical protein